MKVVLILKWEATLAEFLYFITVVVALSRILARFIKKQNSKHNRNKR